MPEKEIQFRKKRELGDVITDSFEFIRQEYKPLLRLIAVYVLPFVVLYSIVQVNLQMKFLGTFDLTNPETLMANLGPVYGNLLISSLFALFVQSLLLGTFYSYIEVYLKNGKGNFSQSDVTPLLFSNSLQILVTNLVIFLVVILGAIMCLIPGIYFANSFSLALAILIFEKRKTGISLSKSLFLVNRQWWNTFLLNLLGVVIIWGVGFVLSIPLLAFGVENTLNVTETNAVEQPASYWIFSGMVTVVSFFAWIVPYAFMAFQYFNLDERFKATFPFNQNSSA